MVASPLVFRGDLIHFDRMGKEEAEQRTRTVKDYLENARRELYEIDKRQGWAAMGYGSFRQYLLGEFPVGKVSSLYRERAAAQVEAVISPDGSIGMIDEGVLRPLTKYKKDPDVLTMLVAVAQKVAGDAPLTGTHTEVTVNILEEAIRTGAFSDDEGNQSPVWQRLEHQAMAAMAERTKIHRQTVKTDIARQSGKLQHRVLEVVMTLTDQKGGRAKFVSPNGKNVVVCEWPENEPLKPGQRITLKILADDET